MEQACTSSRKATLKVGGVLLANRSASHGDAWLSTLKRALTPLNMRASQRQADNHAKMSQSTTQLAHLLNNKTCFWRAFCQSLLKTDRSRRKK